ncbi:hypothetical protein EDD85DRAFT_924068 [Armillaria nabsnona]|nr:hypothetical protein EDD85DRAFT_924068 [Armillaria nabsnona]
MNITPLVIKSLRTLRNLYSYLLKSQAGDHPSAFTINNDHDLKEAWSKVENLLTKEIQKYDVYFRPLWDWTLNLLSDKTLSPFFVWDAMKIFWLDENTNIKIWIFDEPWTDSSSLPPGGKPLAYILYAGKTRLSSFGTEKGYPVVACIANLPDAICNGKTWGGGTVVGWLPVVEDDSRHKGKPSWINFKRVVWHEAFCRIIQSVAEYSHMGYAFKLPHSGDIIIIYPFIFILSADYEEHCMMTLICGNKSAHPCPVCLIPLERLQDLLENVFWSIARSDPYKAVSWDRAFGENTWSKILDSPCSVSIANFPRWRNLMHFKNVTDFDFGDTKKFEHMSKAYSRATYDKGFERPTTWKIPKVCTQQHLFDDIIAKGVTKNYNTKPNECMHGPLKKTYQTQTNFKDVAEQILKTDHHYNIIMQIHKKIDRQKKYQQKETDDLSEDKKNQYHQNQIIGALDSKAMLHSLKFSPKDSHTVDSAYEHFCIHLGRFMTAFLKRIDEDTVAEGEFIQYMPYDIIRIHQTLTVTYQSLVNLKESADLLRCSPSFYNEPRYDGVMINTDKGAYIGQLIQLFECEYLSQQYLLALVHSFDVTVTDGGQCWKFQQDKDLGFYRLRACLRVFSQLVSIYSIIHGVLHCMENPIF